MVISFLKKYWLILIVSLILLLVVFYLIPYQEKSYLSSDLHAIKKKSRLFLLWTELILFGSVFILALRNLKTFKEFLNIVFGIILLALPFFFVFDSIFLSGTYFLNQLSAGKPVSKVYSVVFVDDTIHYLYLREVNTKESILANELLSSDNGLKLRVKDTIIITFKKGLLGFNFDPMLKQ